MHVEATRSDAQLISRKLGAAREALVESQRHLSHASVAWSVTQQLITGIDSLCSVVSGGPAPSAVLNHKAHSSSRSLQDFAERVLKKGRIGKYDVQALQREILVDGITSRADAEVLIALDREVASVHFSWSSFFISEMTQFVVWRSGSAGCIDEDEAMWLRSTLAGDNASDRARRAMLAIAREAQCCDEASSTRWQTTSGTTRSLEQVEFAA